MTLKTALRLDAQQLRFTSLLGLLLTAVAMIVLAQNYYRYSGSEAYSVGLSLAYNLIVYASFVLFVPFIVKLSDKLTFGESKLKWFIKHLIISLSLVLVHMLFCNLVLFAVGLSSSPIFPRFITKYLINVVQVHLLVYWAIVVLKTIYKPAPVHTKNETKTELAQWSRFQVNQKGRTLFLDFEEVLWIEALDHYQKLHTADGYHLIKSSMKQLESVLPNKVFQRAHRSYFVNLSHVQSVLRVKGQAGLSLELVSGVRLKIGKRYNQIFRDIRSFTNN